MSSRYAPGAYPKERSRSPPPPPSRFADHRPSAASLYPERNSTTTSTTANTANSSNVDPPPRGPRSQNDAPARPLPVTAAGGAAAGASAAPAAAPPRPGYSSLREAPPLGTGGERGRSYRERDFARDRVPSPRERERERERSPPPPPRPAFKDSGRDYPPRELDIGRARRDSRDGPLSAGSSYSDGPPLGASSFRPVYSSRARGRGDFAYRSGARPGRSALDERDLFRRDRSPPPLPRWSRDLSRDRERERDRDRDIRDPDRRDDRWFDRRDDDRRPDWSDRERDRDRDRDREREQDRPRRDVPRLDVRASNEVGGRPPSPAAPMDPARRAIIESSSSSTDAPGRRSSIPSQDILPRRDQPEAPAYLNARAETTANRYGSRGSSPPTQAPPVPAFTLSFGPSAAPVTTTAGPPASLTKPVQALPPPTPAVPSEMKPSEPSPEKSTPDPAKPSSDEQSEIPQNAPSAPRAAPTSVPPPPPPGPKAQRASPPPAAAPKAPQALRNNDVGATPQRVPGVRSLENLQSQVARNDLVPKPTQYTTTPASPTTTQRHLTVLTEPLSPRARFAEMNAPPTGPRATRMSPAQSSVSPRLPLTSPRSDMGTFPVATTMPRSQTPPLSAPSGPRNRSFSVSPRVANSAIPTAPKADRVPPSAPRGSAAVPAAAPTRPDRFGVTTSWAPPSAPRSLQQQPWNQWRRAPAPGFTDRVIPAKRDNSGEEKWRTEHPSLAAKLETSSLDRIKTEDETSSRPHIPGHERRQSDTMDVDRQPHSARQSFFGKPDRVDDEDDDEDVDTSDLVQDPLTSSEEDDSDLEDDITLFNAKFERQKRNLEAQMIDLSGREYRATTPLESIARLSCISVQDWERFKEQREHEMEVDEPSPPQRYSGALRSSEREPPLARTAASPESGDGSAVLTPKDEDDARVAIRSSEDSAESVRRIRRPTPEPVILPYLLKDSHGPFHEAETFKENLERQEELQPVHIEAINDELDEELMEDATLEDAFIRIYRQWREECEDLDRTREEEERLERQQSLEPGPEVEAATVPPLSATAEGRRQYKSSSEYELQQVLKESEELARIEQERRDREAKKIQADMEKEAIVPDQMTLEEIRRTMFIDSNRYRDAESLTTIFSYEPPVDNFDDNEQAIFAAAFKETPKKWGEIASLLPNRTYKDCIHHYYATKWDGRFRDHKARRYNGRRGRGGKGGRGRLGGLMADLARTEALTEISDKGRPRRAAAPTTFGEKEMESKANLTGTGKKSGASKGDNDTGSEKPPKRQKRTGEKPGRKPKAAQAAAAAAASAITATAASAAAAIAGPGASPNKHFIGGLIPREDFATKQKLEEASLLASLQTGQHDRHVLYTESFVPMPTAEDVDRKPGSNTSTKQSASSYWSVPEQNDFVRYISYFGRDFGAIASHMGTKTQTMIKNHYQRQIDGGNKPELERAAVEADDRRARGEDMGPPPTPTPIQKRKYEQPQPQTISAPRPLAPVGDPMDVDDATAVPRHQVPKHVSPPQYPPQSQFTSSAQGTPVPAPRVAPSPHPSTAAPAVAPTSTMGTSRPGQHALGNRLAMTNESRSESHAPSQPFHPIMDGIARAQPSTQSGRPAEMPDQFLKNLVEEKDRATRMQHEYTQQERIESLHRQASIHRNQGSPLGQHLPSAQPDRRPLFEDRAPSSPRTTLGGPPLSRTPFESSRFGMLGHAGGPFSLSARSTLDPSPPKRTEPRPGSVPSAPLSQPPPTQPPEQPKRSNLLSLLNSEPEEPKPRASEPPAPSSLTSTQAFQHSSSTSSSLRRDGYGQSSYPTTPYHRTPFGAPSSTPSTTAPNIAHDPSPLGGSLSQSSKPDWAARVLAQSLSASSTPSSLDRDGRSYYSSHRSSLLSGLNQPNRANPSPPPPHSAINHSRNSSLSGPPGAPSLSRDQRPSAAHQPLPPNIQPNPYASQQSSPYTQPPQPAVPLHTHTSMGGPFPTFHQRGVSRDDHKHSADTSSFNQQREREELDRRWGMTPSAVEQRRREEERYLAQQRQQQQEQHDRQAAAAGYGRAALPPSSHAGPPPGPPQPLQPPTFAAGGPPPPYNGPSAPTSRPSTGFGLREEARREADLVYMREADAEQRRRQQQQQQQQDVYMRDSRDHPHPHHEDDYRRRQQLEESYARRTPLSAAVNGVNAGGAGGFGGPPPGPPPPGGRR